MPVEYLELFYTLKTFVALPEVIGYRLSFAFHSGLFTPVRM
jgi:hypothetical protein